LSSAILAWRSGVFAGRTFETAGGEHLLGGVVIGAFDGGATGKKRGGEGKGQG
jgi:hypothetical protein